MYKLQLVDLRTHDDCNPGTTTGDKNVYKEKAAVSFMVAHRTCYVNAKYTCEPDFS